MTGAEVTKKLITVISATFLFFTLSGGISFAGTEKTSQIILRINNFTCSDCHRVISKGLSQLYKDIQISSDPDKKLLIITHPASLKDIEIIRTIQKLGYKVGIDAPNRNGSKVEGANKGSRVTYGYCRSTCNASASTWKQLYNRYFAENK